MCDMTYWYVTCLVHVWHDALMCDMNHWCATWLIHIWYDWFIRDMTRRYATWLNDVRLDLLVYDMTHLHVKWLIRAHLLSLSCPHNNTACTYFICMLICTRKMYSYVRFNENVSTCIIWHVKWCTSIHFRWYMSTLCINTFNSQQCTYTYHIYVDTHFKINKHVYRLLKCHSIHSVTFTR